MLTIRVGDSEMSEHTGTPNSNQSPDFDHSADPRFLTYYSQQSLSDETVTRFRVVQAKCLQLLRTTTESRPALDVLDIGCGPGTQALLWASLGHRVYGLDVSEPFIELA